MLCLVTQPCLTLCEPMECSPPGYSVHGDSPGKNTGVGWKVLQGYSNYVYDINTGTDRSMKQDSADGSVCVCCGLSYVPPAFKIKSPNPQYLRM